MSGDALIALGRRAVACKAWRWLPGMAMAGRPMARVTNNTGDGGPVWAACPGSGSFGFVPPNAVPDLSDPATCGALLALVREAWGDPTAYLRPVPAGWQVLRGDASVYQPLETSEAAALVAAMEAAP